MIDIHCHILPFKDDGSADWEASLQMARDAVRDGITAVIATPHHANGVYLNPASGIIPSVEQLNERIREAGIPLAVLPGQEIRMYEELLNDLERGELLTLGGSRYILLEMPSSRLPRRMEETCHELVIQGFVPVIAHPERNAEVADKPDKLKRLIEIGAIGQVTAQSVAGTFGKKLQKLSLDLCRMNAIHVVASDAHDSQHRPFGLSEAYQVMEKELGQESARIYRQNAMIIAENQEIIRAISLSSGSKLHKMFAFFSRKG